MISKMQIARAYALMECERAPNEDKGFGYFPAQKTTDRFFEKGLISDTERMRFLSNYYPHGDNGVFREMFLDMLAMYEHQNPLPHGQRYTIETDNCFPVPMG